MKYLRNIGKTGATVLAMLLAAVLGNGCATTEPVYPEISEVDGTPRGPEDTFHVGDMVIITYAAPGIEKPKHEERIKGDGTITPPDIGSVAADGKTAGELQTELQEKYDRLFVNMTVTVKPENRFYTVNGEVRQAGPKPYLGKTDVLDAIAAGGGFTEYANRKKIRLIRPNGKVESINYEKAIEDPSYNRSVHPGDKIEVKRRIF